MARYDLYCSVCDTLILDFDHSINEGHPNCAICGTKLETYFPSMVIAFKGFTTPGGNGRPGNLEKRLPSNLKDWYKKATSPEFQASRKKKQNGNI